MAAVPELRAALCQVSSRAALEALSPHPTLCTHGCAADKRSITWPGRAACNPPRLPVRGRCARRTVTERPLSEVASC